MRQSGHRIPLLTESFIWFGGSIPTLRLESWQAGKAPAEWADPMAVQAA